MILIGDGPGWNLRFYLERLATNSCGMARRELGRPQLNYIMCKVTACISQEAHCASVRSVDKCQIGTAVCCRIHTCVWAKCGLLGVKLGGAYGGEQEDIMVYQMVLLKIRQTVKPFCHDQVMALKLSLILRRPHTGTVWFYTSTSNKRAARPKLYTKSLTRDLKCMYSRLTPVRISINL